MLVFVFSLIELLLAEWTYSVKLYRQRVSQNFKF
jgi:hypothetical protein